MSLWEQRLHYLTAHQWKTAHWKGSELLESVVFFIFPYCFSMTRKGQGDQVLCFQCLGFESSLKWKGSAFGLSGNISAELLISQMEKLKPEKGKRRDSGRGEPSTENLLEVQVTVRSTTEHISVFAPSTRPRLCTRETRIFSNRDSQ